MLRKIEIRMDKEIEWILICIDQQVVLDTLDRRTLWRCLMELKLTTKLIDASEAVKGRLQLGSKKTEEF